MQVTNERTTGELAWTLLKAELILYAFLNARRPRLGEVATPVGKT